MKDLFFYKDMINNEIRAFFKTFRKSFLKKKPWKETERSFIKNEINFKSQSKKNEEDDLLYTVQEYTLRGGKRLRASEVIFSWLCFKEFSKEILKVAVSMELLQSYLLIHDDIMDKDSLRRGKPTIHKLYEEYYKKNFINETGKAEHFGVSAAILAGNLAAALVHTPILQSNFDSNKKMLAIEAINKIIIKESYGQKIDITFGLEDISKQEILEMYRLKTVPYTTELPLYLGAMFADASKENIKLLSKIAEKIGIAFQIKDDILGLFGKEEETGKSNISDLREGKKTFIIKDTIEKANNEEKKFILNKIGKSLSSEDSEKIKSIARRTSLDFCINYMDRLIEGAKEILKSMKIREEGKKLLNELANFIIKRDY